ncbi:hypothetical protein IAU59_002287 [Kwoniella sp. CBS 9459]
MSLRSHRSMSSVSSHISGMGWSTVGSDTASLSDTDDMTSVSNSMMDHNDFNHDQHHQQQPSLSIPAGKQGRGKRGAPHNVVHGHENPHGRVPSLSIDPRLFAPKKDDDDAMLETAKPTKSGRGKKSDVVGEPTVTSKGTNGAAKSGSAAGAGKKERKKGGAGGDGGKKISHARKQNADHIPRPRNAFILFRKHVVDSKLIPASVEMRHQNVSIITARMWSEAPPDQKAHFNELARLEKEEHLKKYPGYRYQPVYRRTNVIRRRVRKDEAEEEKCKSVAELLIKGKSGEALENEIKEKIRRGSGSIPVEVKEKVSSRRSSAACELSKGALRALRAQARQQAQGSGEWSDFSRSDSLDPEMSTSSQLRGSRRTSYAMESGSNASSPEPMLGYGLGLAPSQMQGFAQASSSGHQDPQHHHQLQHDSHGFWNMSHVEPHSAADGSMIDGMAYIHPGMANFSFDQPSHNELVNGQDNLHSGQIRLQEQQQEHHHQEQQHFIFPDGSQYAEQVFQPSHSQTPSFASASTDQSFSSDPLTAQTQSHTQPFLYPQPGSGSGLDLHLPDRSFYAYDTALPFSPSAATFSFPASAPITDAHHSGNGNEGLSMQMQHDLYFTQQAQQCQGQNQSQGASDIAGHGQALTDRWELLPPSSGVPFEGLPFDDGLMLGDFEAALAHADEVSGW